MNLGQVKIRPFRYLADASDRVIIKTVDTEKLAPINDAQHRACYRGQAGKRVCAILVMLAMITCLVWSMG